MLIEHLRLSNSNTLTALAVGIQSQSTSSRGALLFSGHGTLQAHQPQSTRNPMVLIHHRGIDGVETLSRPYFLAASMVHVGYRGNKGS